MQDRMPIFEQTASLDWEQAKAFIATLPEEDRPLMQRQRSIQPLGRPLRVGRLYAFPEGVYCHLDNGAVMFSPRFFPHEWFRPFELQPGETLPENLGHYEYTT